MQYIRIRNLREDMDMTQTDMAKNLFISQRTYSYYESGGHDLHLLLGAKGAGGGEEVWYPVQGYPYH